MGTWIAAQETLDKQPERIISHFCDIFTSIRKILRHFQNNIFCVYFCKEEVIFLFAMIFLFAIMSQHAFK